jgi:two-component system response regulator AtoC
MRRVLVLERDEASRRKLILDLRAHAVEAVGLDDPAGAAPHLADAPVEAVVAPFATSGAPAKDWAALAAVAPAAPLVAVVASGPGGPGEDGDEAGMAAIRLGAADFVPETAGTKGLVRALRKVEARRAFGEGGVIRRGRDPERSPAQLLGESPRILAVTAIVRRVAAVKTTVLVVGESGTGKELVARALHDLSPWRAGAFVAVNCAAIPAGVIESELFGHVRGAFTDAVRDRRGFFEQASGGTLFLDEIADLPLALQAKLLRALQEGQIRAVGDVEDRHVDVRVVAATARDLAAEVGAGRFRADLYYRLAGLAIQLPPLRSRRDDIPLLAHHFLARARGRLGLPPVPVSAEAMRLLTEHGWPGNVRELENTMDRAAVLCDGPAIDVASLPEQLVPSASPRVSSADRAGAQAASGSDLSIKRASRKAEEELIRRALTQTGGNRTRAAELLEISHRALLYKIKEYGILIGRAGSGTADRRA